MPTPVPPTDTPTPVPPTNTPTDTPTPVPDRHTHTHAHSRTPNRYPCARNGYAGASHEHSSAANADRQAQAAGNGDPGAPAASPAGCTRMLPVPELPGGRCHGHPHRSRLGMERCVHSHSRWGKLVLPGSRTLHLHP
jgi:hypothetical protein